jgi:hypothetical protein
MQAQAMVMKLESIKDEEVLTNGNCYLFKVGFAAWTYNYCSLEP